MESKKELRTELIAALNAIPFFSLIEKSQKLSDQFFALANPFFERTLPWKSFYVVSFYPFQEEIQINVEREAKDEAYEIAYVRVEDWQARTMECRRARRDQPEDWEEISPAKHLRIFQPHASTHLCETGQVAMILVPALGFAPDGNRIGRGAGFYDRMLKQFPHALRVGVGVTEQIRAQLPADPWDEKVDVVLTDSQFFSSKNFEDWQKHGKVSR